MNFVTQNEFLRALKRIEAPTPAETTYPLIFAKVSLGSNQSISHNTVTTVAFDTVLTDDEGLWDSVNHAFVIPAGYTKMDVKAEVAFSSHATGYRLAVVRKDSAAFNGAPSFNIPSAGAGVGTFQTFTGTLEVEEGQKYSIQAFQSSGDTLNVEKDTTWFAITLYPDGMPAIKGKDGTNGAPGANGTDGHTPVKGVDYDDGANGTNGVSMRNKGAWSSATEYVNNASYIDVVTHNGSSYICKLTGTNHEPPNATYWDVAAQKGLDGEGAGDVIGPATHAAGRVPLWGTANSKALLEGKELAGADAKILTGTPAASGRLSMWNADGDVVDASLAANAVPKAATKQVNGTNSAISNQEEILGFGWVQGNGTKDITVTCYFQDSHADYYADDFIFVNAWSIGACTVAGGAPADPVDLIVSSGYSVANAELVTKAGFTLRLQKFSNDGSAPANFLNTYYYGFGWRAIGTKART